MQPAASAGGVKQARVLERSEGLLRVRLAENVAGDGRVDLRRDRAEQEATPQIRRQLVDHLGGEVAVERLRHLPFGKVARRRDRRQADQRRPPARALDERGRRLVRVSAEYA